MDRFEKKLRSVKLRKPAAAFEDRMNALFAETGEGRSPRLKRFLPRFLAVAASLVLTAVAFWVVLKPDGGLDRSSLRRRQSASMQNQRGGRFVVALDKELSPVFGVDDSEPHSFFDSEKIDLKRMSFVVSH